MHRFRPLAAALAVMATASAATAAPPSVVGPLVTGTVIPGFQAVRAATRVQATAWKGFCAGRATGDPKTLQAAYGALGDAWAKIEFIRAGPAESELRVERFNYWLDREGATSRALSAMLAGAGPLDPASLKAGSVAGQGMPVLERLLYGKDAAALQAPGADGDRRCAIGVAVAGSLQALADEMLSGWTAPDGAAAAIAANHSWGVTFSGADEASRVLLTDLVGGLDNLKDSKVALAFHDEANPGAAQLAEDARSGRALRDAMLNFTAIRQAIDLYMTPASPAQKATLAEAFAAADTALKAAEAARDRSPPHSDDRQATLKATVAALNTLLQTVMTVVPAGSGVSLGFNNLDGD